MNWQPLSKLNPSHGESQRYEFRFPCGTTYYPIDWKDLVIQISEWLWETGYLKLRNCPIKRPNARIRYLVHTEPRHSDGSSFSDWHIVGGLYLETPQGDHLEARPGVFVETKDNNDRLVENARIIIENVAPQKMREFHFRKVA